MANYAHFLAFMHNKLESSSRSDKTSVWA